VGRPAIVIVLEVEKMPRWPQLADREMLKHGKPLRAAGRSIASLVCSGIILQFQVRRQGTAYR